MRSRSRSWLGAAAVLALALGACGPPPDLAAEDGVPPAPEVRRAPSAAPTGPVAGAGAGKPRRWAKIKPWPYAPWYSSMTAWAGNEVLVFGAGNPDPKGSPPPFAFRTRAAGGAYDLARDTWRPIAPAPFPLGSATAVTVGEEIYAAAGRYKGRTFGTEVWIYSPGTDRWRQVVDPPPTDGYTWLTAAGDTVAVWHTPPAGRASAHLYDAARDSWRPAPEVPWPGPAEFAGLPDGRLVVFGVVPEPSPMDGTEPGTGGFVEGYMSSPDGTGDAPRRRQPQPGGCWAAAVLDPAGTSWRPLPPSGIFPGTDSAGGYAKWTFAAGRLVRAQRGNIAARHVTPDCASTDPVPSSGALDVDAGRWEHLPALPGEEHGSYGGGFSPDDITDGGGDFALHDGWVYDARRRVWREMPEIRGRELGFESLAYTWAGDRLVLFANAIHRPLDPEGIETRVVRAHEGWSWRP